jgi:hypothetical protein
MKPASQKLRVYEALFTLNQAFEQVLSNLRHLQAFPFFRREFLREIQVVVEETQAWVNFDLIEVMHSREQDDWTRFGRLRQKFEKKYRDPNDVLIEAGRKLRKSSGKRRSKGGSGGSHA